MRRGSLGILVAVACAAAGLLVSPARADWHGGGGGRGDWPGGWHHGGWSCCWRGGVFIGVVPQYYFPPPYPVVPPDYVPPPAYPVPPADYPAPPYYSPYGDRPPGY